MTENFSVVGMEISTTELPSVIPSALIHVINTLESDDTHHTTGKSAGTRKVSRSL